MFVNQSLALNTACTYVALQLREVLCFSQVNSVLQVNYSKGKGQFCTQSELYLGYLCGKPSSLFATLENLQTTRLLP